MQKIISFAITCLVTTMSISNTDSMNSNSKPKKGSSSTSIVVGLNGALQKRFILRNDSTLVPGNVHRAQKIQIGVGGKGQDVANALMCLGYKQRTQLVQFLGTGPEGDAVYELLHNKLDNDAMELTIRSKSSLRTCTSIIANDVTTELVEPSGCITENEINQLMELLPTSNIHENDGDGDDGVAAVCIMGSMPPGCSDKLYGNIYQQISSYKTLCVIDTVAGINYLLDTIGEMKVGGGSKHAHSFPTILKINASELCKLVQIKPQKETDRIEKKDVIAAVSTFLSLSDETTKNHRRALNAIAITDGKHSAYFVSINANENENHKNNHKNDNNDNCSNIESFFHIYEVPVPSLEQFDDNSDDDEQQQEQQLDTKVASVCPIGAGDAVAAGTLAAWRYFLSSSPSSSCFVNEDIEKALEKSLHQIHYDNSNDDNHFTQCMISSFAFGLSCGSASCLEEENSDLQVSIVLRLYSNIMQQKLTFISSHKIL